MNAGKMCLEKSTSDAFSAISIMLGSTNGTMLLLVHSLQRLGNTRCMFTRCKMPQKHNRIASLLDINLIHVKKLYNSWQHYRQKSTVRDLEQLELCLFLNFEKGAGLVTRVRVGHMPPDVDKTLMTTDVLLFIVLIENWPRPRSCCCFVNICK